MTRYSKQDLETRFRRIASSRINEKKRDNSKYAGDAGYWDGGRCNYGGAHNLQEDCETLAQFFAGIAELKNAQQQLVKFTNQSEFEKNKQELLTRVNNSLSGLNIKTGASTSIGGICIIWADFKEQVEGIINDFRGDVERLKRGIENVPYNEAKELQKLLIEEKSLKNEIEENERKARNEPDENKRKQFIFLVDQAKDRLKKCLERRKQLKTGRLGDDFNPDKHINDFLQKLEDKLSGRNRPQRPTKTPNRTPTSPDDPSEPDNVNFPSDNYVPNPNKEPKSFLEKHWKELLLGGAFLLTFYYITQQKEDVGDNHG